jgi:hypothetical protein
VSPLPRLSSLRRGSVGGVGGVVALAVATGLIVWLVTRGGGGTAASTTTADTTTQQAVATPIGPIAVSESGLKTLAGSIDQPLYWVGPVAGARYELTRKTDGNVFVRYLPRGVEAGDTRPFLTVGTYPLKDAFAATENVSKENRAVHRTLPNGWIAVYRGARPTNIYLARRGLAYQIEVFDPSPAKARQLVEGGRARPIR